MLWRSQDPSPIIQTSMVLPPNYNPRYKLAAKIKDLREPFSSASHLGGALFAAIGAVYLIWCSSCTTVAICASLLYAVPLVCLLVISGLLHGLHASSELLHKLERLDHAAIYLFIAGTYTPVCIYALGDNIGFWLLLTEWTLAIIGIWLTLSRGPAHPYLQVAIFIVMGWGWVFAFPSLFKNLGSVPFNLLVIGGIFYSVGALLFAVNPPNVFRLRLSAHDCWHVLVLLGSAAHYAFILQIIR